jgi:hypothetical protein
MQLGSLTSKSRLDGSDVWQFRWSEKSPNGRRLYRKRVIGTVEQYPNVETARNAVSSLMTEVNWVNLRANSIVMGHRTCRRHRYRRRHRQRRRLP